MKNKSLISTINIILVTVLLLSLFTGCQSQESRQKEDTQKSTVNEQTTEKPSEKSEEPPAKITILTGNFRGTDFNNVETTRIIEERTNTKINVIAVSWGDAYSNKQNVMLASQDLPDIMIVTGTADEIKFCDAGIILPLNKYWDKYTNIKKCRSEKIWEIMTYKDGNVYFVPTTAKIDHDNPLMVDSGPLYRKDWLDKFGLDIPTTLDEYYEVADAVSNRDPDGNNKKDTFAIIGCLGLMEAFGEVFSAFGVQPDNWMEKDGEIVFGSAQPETKEALKFLKKMYDNGMIDPEFITDDQQRRDEKIKLGIMGAGSYYLENVLDPDNAIYKKFKENNPNGEYVAGPRLTQEGYTPAGGRGLPMRGWMKTGILAGSKNIDAALRVLDLICSDEYTMIYNYGIEGKHYVKNPDGTVRVIAKPEEMEAFGINLTHIPVVRTTLALSANENLRNAMLNLSKSSVINMTDKYLVPELEYTRELDDYTREQFSKMIIGNVPIDGGFENYIEELNKRGYKELYEALNKAHKEMQQR